MRFFLWLVVLFIPLTILAKDVYVEGYTRSDGTYVKGHYRTSPDSTINNNYSTQGNINPYTGKKGWIPRESESAVSTESWSTQGSYSYGVRNTQYTEKPVNMWWGAWAFYALCFGVCFDKQEKKWAFFSLCVGGITLYSLLHDSTFAYQFKLNTGIMIVAMLLTMLSAFSLYCKIEVMVKRFVKK